MLMHFLLNIEKGRATVPSATAASSSRRDAAPAQGCRWYPTPRRGWVLSAPSSNLQALGVWKKSFLKATLRPNWLQFEALIL